MKITKKIDVSIEIDINGKYCSDKCGYHDYLWGDFPICRLKFENCRSGSILNKGGEKLYSSLRSTQCIKKFGYGEENET